MVLPGQGLELERAEQDGPAGGLATEMRSRAPLRVGTRSTTTSLNSLASRITARLPSQEHRQVLGAQHRLVHGDLPPGQAEAVRGGAEQVRSARRDQGGFARVPAAAEQQQRRLDPQVITARRGTS